MQVATVYTDSALEDILYPCMCSTGSKELIIEKVSVLCLQHKITLFVYVYQATASKINTDIKINVEYNFLWQK